MRIPGTTSPAPLSEAALPTQVSPREKRAAEEKAEPSIWKNHRRILTLTPNPWPWPRFWFRPTPPPHYYYWPGGGPRVLAGVSVRRWDLQIFREQSWGQLDWGPRPVPHAFRRTNRSPSHPPAASSAPWAWMQLDWGRGGSWGRGGRGTPRTRGASHCRGPQLKKNSKVKTLPGCRS